MIRLTQLIKRRWRVGFVVISVITLLSLAALPAAAQAEPAQPETAKPDPAGANADEPPGTNPPDCPGPFAKVSVTVDPQSEPLDVTPDSVEIYKNPGPGRAGLVCWQVTGLEEGQTLHIVGKPDEPDLFPDLARKIVFPNDSANSGQPSGTGTWEYSLWITNQGSHEQHHFTDPEVIVGGGP